MVNEAMASGVPVLVSMAAGCVEDLLEPWPPGDPLEAASLLQRLGLRMQVRRNGFAFDPGSPDELSRALRFILLHPACAAEMGAAGCRIISQFSCENFAVNALQAARLAAGGELATREEGG